ncbi:RNA polymerase sigma factor [Inediibacterium massiliense]|uniref:RNA polymerase sigma factor n=1 Tax=Inediibacterium massiliense TaxID=1658111 RepID=UPI0006B69CCA|nr:sigma-70 family RNA polymerase sigma factor [Inediibacterium massiliense]
MDIQDLVQKSKQGDQEALVKLIMSKKDDYYKLAYVYMKNSEDAMDAMEDMIVILYENIYQLKKENAFFSWSKTILVNCCKNILRQNKKSIALDFVEDRFYESGFEEKEDQIMIEKYLSRLNHKHQEIIKLRYFLGLDYETISNILKIPLGTVKSRISIGIKKLRKMLEVKEDE